MSDTLFTRRPARVPGLLLAGLAALLISPAREARAQADEGMTIVADGGAATIDAHGVCRIVQNMTGLDVMVPHSIPEEWYTGGNSFLENVPENMSTSPCPTTIVGDCSDLTGVYAEWLNCSGPPGGRLVLRYDTRYAIAGMSNNAANWRPINSATFPNPQNPNCLAISCLMPPGVTSLFSNVNREMQLTTNPQITPFRTPTELNGVRYVYPYPNPQSVPNHGHARNNNIVPLFLTGAYVDVTIDWGGPTNNCPTTVTEPTAIYCEYTTEGVYDVTVTGILDRFGVGETSRYPLNWRHTPYSREGTFLGVLEWEDGIGLRSLQGAFANAIFIRHIPDHLPSTVEDISYIFAYTGYAGMFGIWGGFPAGYDQTPWGNVTGWDTSNVRNMRAAFAGRGTWIASGVGGRAFNADISGWDVSNVEDFSLMFNRAAFNQDISGWDVSSGRNFNDMFAENAPFTHDLSGWCTAGVSSVPEYFTTASAGNLHSNAALRPVWGGCPGNGILPEAVDVPRDTLITSEALSFPGVPAGFGTISGDGGAEFSVNGGPWVTSGQISGADSVRIRMTSASGFLERSRARITLDSGPFIQFETRTYAYPLPDMISLGEVFTANGGAVTESGVVTISGLRAGYTVPVTVSGDGSPQIRINEGPWTGSGTLTGGDRLQVRLTSATTQFEERVATLEIGDQQRLSPTFRVRTAPTTAQLVSLTVSQANANAHLRSNFCSGAYSAGQTVNVQTFFQDVRTGPYAQSGVSYVGCVRQASVGTVNGQLQYFSTTVTFVGIRLN